MGLSTIIEINHDELNRIETDPVFAAQLTRAIADPRFVRMPAGVRRVCTYHRGYGSDVQKTIEKLRAEQLGTEALDD